MAELIEIRLTAGWAGRWLFLLLLLAGCQPFAPTAQPELPLPQTYRVAAGTHVLTDAWWRDLGSEPLNELIAEALATAPDIRTARARLEQARALAAKSGAPLWPGVEGSAEASKTWLDSASRIESESYGLGLAASYELDLWGRIRAVQRADLLEVAASADDLRTAALSVSGEIAEAWISLCSVRQQLAILEDQQRTNADILSTLELRFANSLASALDVLQQREAIAQTATRIHPLQAEAARLENRLHLLAGKAPGMLDLAAATRLPAPLALPATGLPADLLRERPDIRADWARLLEAGWDVAAARADRLPALRLSGRFERNGTEASRAFDNWLAALAAGMTAPVFDGGSRAAQVRRQQATYEQRLAAYEQTVLAALAEVDAGVQTIRQQFDLLAALAVQRDAAQAALRSARIRYQNGVLTYDTVLSLLLKLQQLERTAIQEQASLLIAQTGLYRSLGRGWRGAYPEVSSNDATQQP